MVVVLFAGLVKAADKAEPTKYEPTVESLRKAEIPEWFIDGKLGIFMHWGPESIPGVASTWYARWMYEQGSEGYKYHCATYGHPSKFGYKDICKLFKAPKFDQAQADRLVKLYKQAGARYVVPVASHHDNFDMWDSKYQPRWNSMATAGKDVCGMWQKATVANGLHFGVASHVARTYRWLQVSHGADKTGPLAGVPYDGQDPAYADLYGVPWNDTGYGYEGPQDVGPPAFEQNFEDRMKDLIDRYHPDLYYTDGGPPFKDKGYKVVSHLYNQSIREHGGKLQAVANFKGGCPIGAENFEFEFPGTLQKNFWQTDKTMAPEWYWLRNQTNHYRKGFEIVHTLIDVVSKNGNLLLNVPLTGDGELEDATINMLKDMAHDFNLIGEAIFDTRTWEAFGEGEKNFNSLGSGTAKDIRFTRNKANTVLYITTLGWPGDGAVVKIKTLNKHRIDLKSLKSVSLLGSADKLNCRQDVDSLQITLPPKAPYSCSAYPIKLTFSGTITKLNAAAKLLWQAQARDLSGPADRSAYGLTADGGVLLLDVPAASDAAKAGLKKDDVISACNSSEAKTIEAVRAQVDKAAGQKLALSVIRQQKPVAVELSDYFYAVMETQANTEFKDVPLTSAVVPGKVSVGGPATRNDPIDALVDGKVVSGFGPIFANGVTDGAYKLDLGEAKSVGQVNTFSSGGKHRAKQNYILYGSNAAIDPGWNVADKAVFTPIMAVDTREAEPKAFEATSVRRSGGKPLGSYRWLVWAVSPINGEIGGENTAFQELQVIAAGEPTTPRSSALSWPGEKTDTWHGFRRHNFKLEGYDCWVVEPKQVAPGNPWTWCTENPDAFTDRTGVPQLIEKGFHHVHVSAGDNYGNQATMRVYDAFYKVLAAKGLAKKGALVGLSRGELCAYNWAADNTDKVACIYGDAPVCDFKSWPGGKGPHKGGSSGNWDSLIKAWGFKDEAEAMDYKFNPVDNLANIAKAKIPIIHVVGDADGAVPPEDNSAIVEERYKKLGGEIVVIHKPGVGHHPHGLDDPKVVVDFIIKNASPNIPGRWTAERAQEWYRKQPWPCGFNYIPANAISYTEMWMDYNFDPQLIDKELSLAQDVGFNCLRVVLPFVVWEKEPEAFKKCLNTFLSICQKRGLKVMFTLFDDCAFGPIKDPVFGKQPDVVTGLYASGWTPSPGHSMVQDASTWPRLEKYVKDLLTTFGQDHRVWVWDLYNEPTVALKGALVQKVFEWARTVNPSQPLTVDKFEAQLNQFLWENNDINTFHNYSPSEQLQGEIIDLLKQGRPVICTEWLNRAIDSTVAKSLPVFREHQVGAMHWGLVNGKTQTHLNWGHQPGQPDPKVWQHDIFRPDHTPYDPQEIELFKQYIHRNQSQRKDAR